MKIVENLFPELCNIYGESYSMTYLSRCNPEIDLRLTNHKTTPAFVTEDVDMIYLGCSPERKQEQIIQLLRPYTDRLRQLIDRGVIILATGNALVPGPARDAVRGDGIRHLRRSGRGFRRRG